MSDHRGADGHTVSERWTKWRQQVDLHEFHTRWARREAEGAATHGEADFIERLAPTSVLDAGCGMGRVAIELDRRGIAVHGVDLDADLLEFARRDAPHLTWHHADLATMDLGHRYSMVAMPGNVMIFCRPSQRADVVASAVRHLEPGGLLVAGFSLEPQRGVPGYDQGASDVLTLAEYDAHCDAAGLVLQSRFATWEGAPYEGGNYAISVHQHQHWR